MILKPSSKVNKVLLRGAAKVYRLVVPIYKVRYIVG